MVVGHAEDICPEVPDKTTIDHDSIAVRGVRPQFEFFVFVSPFLRCFFLFILAHQRSCVL